MQIYALGEWCVSFTRYCKYQSLSCAPLCAQFWGCPACYWYLLKVLNGQQKAHHLNPPLAEKIDKKWGNSHSGRVDLMKNCLLSIPAEGASAKLHAITFWAYHNGLPCDQNWLIPQVGTIGAQLLCMETKLQMVFSDWLCLPASAEG